MSFEPRDYLRHILVEADYLIGRSEGLSFESFSSDETLRRAFVRSLEIIGEATKKVPDDFRAAYPAVEWRAKEPSRAGVRSRGSFVFLGQPATALLHPRQVLASAGDTLSASSKSQSPRLSALPPP